MSDRPKKLLRQFKRYLGSVDAEQELAALAASLDQLESAQVGDIAGEKPLLTLQNFPKFLDAIEKAYGEYEERLRSCGQKIPNESLM